MKHLLVILIAIVGMWLQAEAQTGLNIEKMLGGKYASDPNVTETFISGNRNKFLDKHHLRLFATFKGPADKYEATAEELVKKDAAAAVGKNVRYKGGRLYYGLYSLKPVTIDGRKVYRYLYYLNNGAVKGKTLLVIYFEGNITEDKALQLIRSMRKGMK